MQHPDAPVRAVAIAIHDVSPPTWRECRKLLAMLDDAGAPPVSLLVIPDYHHRGPVIEDRAFARAMDARLARGDELVLHGYFHVDDAPPPRTLPAWFARRMLTRSEGEFAAIDQPVAESRIARGIEMFRTLGWPLHGFVPPAWLMNAATRAALAQCGHRFDYVTVKGGIFRVPEWSFERTANFCYSPGTVLRRAMSAAAIRRELWKARSTPLLRISLHPQDARVPAVLDHWRRLVGDALSERTPVTKQNWAVGLKGPLPNPLPGDPRSVREVRAAGASSARSVS